MDIEKDVLHSSSDGQRLETQRNTLNARHASKYFGLKKGISALALIGNHVPINAKVIGTHEHESYFVFDLLYNNTTDIVPERHSVDTHGTNQVNFWILHVFGYQFAPRYRNFPAKTENIIGFSQPGEYDEAFPIKPSRKVNEELIIEEWPSVQHIMASLGQKETTQSAIVRKLSSYARQNKTKKALWELDNSSFYSGCFFLSSAFYGLLACQDRCHSFFTVTQYYSYFWLDTLAYVTERLKRFGSSNISSHYFYWVGKFSSLRDPNHAF